MFAHNHENAIERSPKKRSDNIDISIVQLLASLRAVAPRAIRSARAYAVDATTHFSRPGPRVADGVELLAALLHPDLFPEVSIEGRAHPVGD